MAKGLRDEAKLEPLTPGQFLVEVIMIRIGENLNVINRVIGKAFKEMDPRPIVEEAIRQKEKGVDNGLRPRRGRIRRSQSLDTDFTAG